MNTEKKFEIGQDVYVVNLDRTNNEYYYVSAKVEEMDVDGSSYLCKLYASNGVYQYSAKHVFETHHAAEEFCKQYTIMKIKTKMPKVELSDFEKLKIAYEVMRDIEDRDDLKAGTINALSVIKNFLANEIAYSMILS